MVSWITGRSSGLNNNEGWDIGDDEEYKKCFNHWEETRLLIRQSRGEAAANIWIVNMWEVSDSIDVPDA